MRLRPARCAFVGLAVFATVSLAATPLRQVHGDLLVPRSGKPAHGAIVTQNDREVVLNVYWSRNPGVTNPDHLIRVPVDKVKKAELRPHPQVEVFRRLAKARTAAELVAVGDYAADNKLKGHARMCYALAVAQEADHAEALKKLGGRPKWESTRKGNPQLDLEIPALLARYVAEEDPAEREKLQRPLKERGFAAKSHEFERYRRASHQPKGYQQNRPLAWRSEHHPGAVYTLYVPDAYVPVRPWPLIIGLHGGGADGKAGDEVVGNGPSAMNFYRRMAAERGFLVACPTALLRGWSSKPNEELVKDVIAELRLLYHVDIDRIYMTGHSMGGFGTWSLGPRMAEDLAAISPMAGAGSGVGRLASTKTPIFIYHSDNDYVRVDSDRAAARQLRDSDLDFVYTELPGQGHGFPPSIQVELFDFFGPRRRYDKRYKDVWPRSSFVGKVSKEEERYLGHPLEALRGEEPDLKAWLGHLRLGGGRAHAAVSRIVERKPEGAAAGVAKVLRNAKLPFDGRAYAARTLGLLGDAGGLAPLRKAVAQEASKEQSMIARECARALTMLNDPESLANLAKGIEAWTVYYESKVSGGGLRFSDWQRSTAVLGDLVAAWAALAPADARSAILEKTVVSRVFAPQHQVATSERVPQDPSGTRTPLARAVATAYQKTGVQGERWDKLLEALANDPKARAAAEALKP